MLEVWTVASFDTFLLGKTGSNSIDGRYSLASGHYRPVGKASTMSMLRKAQVIRVFFFPYQKILHPLKRTPIYPSSDPHSSVESVSRQSQFPFMGKRLSAKSEEKCQNLKVLAICWSGSVLHVKISALAAWCSRCQRMKGWLKNHVLMGVSVDVVHL